MRMKNQSLDRNLKWTPAVDIYHGGTDFVRRSPRKRRIDIATAEQGTSIFGYINCEFRFRGSAYSREMNGTIRARE